MRTINTSNAIFGNIGNTIAGQGITRIAQCMILRSRCASYLSALGEQKRSLVSLLAGAWRGIAALWMKPASVAVPCVVVATQTRRHDCSCHRNDA